MESTCSGSQPREINVFGSQDHVKPTYPGGKIKQINVFGSVKSTPSARKTNDVGKYNGSEFSGLFCHKLKSLMKNWEEFTKDRKTVVILNLSGVKGSLSTREAAQTEISNRK